MYIQALIHSFINETFFFFLNKCTVIIKQKAENKIYIFMNII